MLATGLCLALLLFAELAVTLLVTEPLQRLKAGQPRHYRSFGMSLLPLWPSRIGFILYLALGEYRLNVESPETVWQLAKARPFALLYLAALIAFVVSLFA